MADEKKAEEELTEEEANVVCSMRYKDELKRILKPNYAKFEMLSDAAKRCAAMASKLPAAQKKAARYREAIRHLRHTLGLTESARLTFRHEANNLGRWLKIADAELENWKRKAARIAAALGIREKETLVEAAERVAQEATAKKIDATMATSPVYGDLIKRVEEAEAVANSYREQERNWFLEKQAIVPRIVNAEREARDWKRSAESLMADFYRPILAALGISEALTFKGACERVLAEVQTNRPMVATVGTPSSPYVPRPAPPGNGICPDCGGSMIDVTDKSSTRPGIFCPYCKSERRQR